MATSHKEWTIKNLVERGDRDMVLGVISAKQSVTIEELSNDLPWMRWGYLFSILGECLHEGLVILCQKEFQFEVRAIHALSSGNGEDVLTGSFSSKPGDRQMAI
ncbi:MAG TPA: hypothetical protein PKM72_08205 [Nitrospirales bacterium]|nr:hypothetical protein [Nitrospira sp. MA-1]HNP60805.1 hypothetical protein [Nitrospirales bacterium]